MNPAKRPKTEHILEALHEMEQTYGFIETGLCTSSATRVSLLMTQTMLPHAIVIESSLYLKIRISAVLTHQ